jgi:hypothetical protein
MKGKKWIGFTDSEKVDISPNIDIERTTPVTERRRDAEIVNTLRVRYTIGGAWEGDIQQYKSFEVPNTSNMEVEGAPAVPKDGIFVALPDDAEDVEIHVLDKQVHTIDEYVNLVPAPKQYVEEEFKEEYQPDPTIYENDEPYPGKDFDFIGVKRLEGIKVAHILVYLGQYRPKSKTMELVSSIDLEISYKTPPGTDRKVPRKPRETTFDDMILGLDLLNEKNDFSGKVEDYSDLDSDEVMMLEDDPSAIYPPGISKLETIEDESEDPPVATASLATPTLAVSTAALTFAYPKLKRTSIICEYVIITTPALSSSVEPLRNAKKNWPYYARVALTTDIKAEFPQRSLKESIREFISWANKNWRCPPRFVILAGDTDTIPIHIYNRGGRRYASDHYYADLEGDLVPEITVSRLPSSDANELKRICYYIVNYPRYRDGDWGWWQNRVMLCAYQSSTYETTCDQVADKIKRRYRVIKRYAKNTTKDDVKKTMNSGVLFAVYRGHGSKTAWSSSNGLNTTDISNLNNYGKPPFVLNICCQNGWIDDNATETVSETFVRDRKAVAVFASSRNSWTYPNNDFIKYVFDAVICGRAHDPARIIRYAKLKMVRNHPTSTYHHDNVVMYNLFGDPTADVASHVEYMRGTWDMDHDGWKGALKLTRIYNYHIVTGGNYQAPVWNISGNYVKSNGQSYPFSGKIGGFDNNQLGTGSKRSDHKIEFRVKFSTYNNQRFLGYIHTWTRNVVSGLTWWSKHPFGWTAKKR